MLMREGKRGLVCCYKLFFSLNLLFSLSRPENGNVVFFQRYSHVCVVPNDDDGFSTEGEF